MFKLPFLARMARLGVQVAGNVARTAGRRAAANTLSEGIASGAKLVFMLILSVLLVIGIVVIAIWYLTTMLLRSVLCMAMLNFFHGKCPTPLFDGGQINKIASNLEKERKKADGKSEDDIQIFKKEIKIDMTESGMSPDEVEKSFEDYKERDGVFKIDEGELKVSEARLYLMVLQQLDEEVINIYGKNPVDFQKGGKLSDTNYGRMLSTFTNQGEKKLSERSFTKSSSKFRQNVWECYTMTSGISKRSLTHKKCKEDGVLDQIVDDAEKFSKEYDAANAGKLFDSGEALEKLMNEEKVGVMTKLKKIGDNKANAVNKNIIYMLKEYYPVSLYYGLPNGESMFEERLDQIMEDLDIQASVDIDLSSYDGGGYLLPMPYGTYNFRMDSQGFLGPRSGRKHAGVDFGTTQTVNIPIISPASGVVREVGGDNDAGTGYYAIIDHPDGYSTRYLHIHPGSRLVKAGDQVARGQIIAGVGGSGGYDPHLHFELCAPGESREDGDGSGEMGSAVCNEHTNVNPESSPFNLDVGPTDATGDWDERWRKEFEQNILPRSKEGEVFVMPGSSFLGYLAASCETGALCTKDPDWGHCVNNTGAGDSGGLSCGGVQISTGNKRNWTMQNFFNYVKDRNTEIYDRLNKYDYLDQESEFKKEFRSIAEDFPMEFPDLQVSFMGDTHYEPARQYMVENGLDPDIRSHAYREFLFSTAVQFRYSLWNNSPTILQSAGIDPKPSNYDKLTDLELVERMVEAKKERASNSAPNLRQGLRNRYQGELNWVKDNIVEGDDKEDGEFKHIDIEEYMEFRGEEMARLAKQNEDLERDDLRRPSFPR